MFKGYSCPKMSPRNALCPHCSVVRHAWHIDNSQSYSVFRILAAERTEEHDLSATIAAGEVTWDFPTVESTPTQSFDGMASVSADFNETVPDCTSLEVRRRLTAIECEAHAPQSYNHVSHLVWPSPTSQATGQNTGW